MKATNLLILMTLCVVTASGCASGSIMMMGDKLPPIRPSMVKVLDPDSPPRNKTIAVIIVDSGGKGQKCFDNAMAEAKKKAAGIGADGLILNMSSRSTVFINYWPVDETHFTFKAVTLLED